MLNPFGLNFKKLDLKRRRPHQGEFHTARGQVLFLMDRGTSRAQRSRSAGLARSLLGHKAAKALCAEGVRGADPFTILTNTGSCAGLGVQVFGYLRSGLSASVRGVGPELLLHQDWNRWVFQALICISNHCIPLLGISFTPRAAGIQLKAEKIAALAWEGKNVNQKTSPHFWYTAVATSPRQCHQPCWTQPL